MSQREQLLQAILADPDDVSLRLVFADWLEERDDPVDQARAEFIRLQCEDDRLGLTDPGHSERFGKWLSLERKYGGIWFRELMDLVGDIEETRCGFPYSLLLPAGEFVRHAARVFELAPVREVWLEAAAACPGELARCRHLERLHTLVLLGPEGDGGLSAADVRVLAASPYLGNIVDLDISDNPIGSDGVIALTAAPHLRKLASLSLRGTGTDDRGAAALGTAEQLASLNMLDLCENDIGMLGVQAVATAEHLAGLERLFLSENPVGDMGVLFLSSSAHLRRLESLWLTGVGMTANSLAQLAASPVLASVASLEIGHNDLGPEGIYALVQNQYRPRPAAEYFANLKSLHLHGTELDAEAAEMLTELWSFPNLTWLALDHNPLGSEGIEYLATCPHLAQLDRLSLDGTDFDNDGLKFIAGSPHLAGAKELTLGSNGLGDEAAEILAASPHLGRNHLTLLHNDFSDRGKELLKQRFADRVTV